MTAPAYPRFGVFVTIRQCGGAPAFATASARILPVSSVEPLSTNITRSQSAASGKRGWRWREIASTRPATNRGAW